MNIKYLIVFFLGLTAGSFINVCVHSIPKGKSIIKSLGFCGNCGAESSLAGVIPVAGYFFQKRKCRNCGIKIPVTYPLAELASGITWTLLFHRYGMSADFIFFVFLISVLMVVFFIDLEHRIIPDSLVLIALGGGLVAMAYNAFYPLDIYGDSNWWSPILGIVPGSGTLFLIALIGILIYKSDDAMGMGDVKIFAPIGVFLGWKMCFISLVLSILIGGITSMLLMITRIKKRSDSIPFGPFIVVSAFITIMWGSDILSWYMARSGF